jgi:DNA (cytosine-5)-methyltransferase 1
MKKAEKKATGKKPLKSTSKLVRKTAIKSKTSIAKTKSASKGALRSTVHEPAAQYNAKRSFKFIDLFCGIGGFHLGFSRQGGECVFASDWDKYSQKTYATNFPGTPLNGDITKVPVKDIPEHNILCAGFPCQPFSIAGVSKKNSLGRKHGFEDERQGNLFFNIAAILEHHRPEAFVLENVKNLKSHDKGNTFKVIHKILTEDLKYHVHYRIIDAQCWVPQHRERIFIVGFREPRAFEWPEIPKNGPKLGEILEHKAPEKYTLTDHLWTYLQNYAAKHKAAGNGFGFGLVSSNDIARTLSARYHKDGSEILINQGKGRNPRRLMPRECARLMGYPETFKIDQVSDTQAYRQFGNSVVVPVVQHIAKSIVAALQEEIVDRPRLVLEMGEPKVVYDIPTELKKAKANKRKQALPEPV